MTPSQHPRPSEDTADQTWIIVGAGHAAGQLAVSARQQGFEGKLILIGEEAQLPYQRPPLSKKYLSGEFGLERVWFKPPDFYKNADIETRLQTRVTKIDRAARTITLDGGQTLTYDKLALTTGSRVRRLPIPGADLGGIHYLRTVDDVDAMRAGFVPGKRLVIIGGGYIGLEVAAVATGLGLKVTVVEMEDRVLKRVTCPQLSDFFEQTHKARGVDIKCQTAIAAFEGDENVTAIVTSTGEKIPADIALVGVGIVPNNELAEAAGLEAANGIKVDEFCCTEDPNIFAAGDCTDHPSALYERRIRLESVHNALEQAKTAAAAMGGTLKAYDQVPWFWSDQYEFKLQIAGLSTGYDTVVQRGDPKSGKFALFYIKDTVIIAVDAINAAPEYMMGRRLIGERASIPPQRLADTSIAMKEMA